MNNINKIIIGLCAASFYTGSTNLALARWATFDDAPLRVNYNSQHIYINKDATFKLTHESEYSLLKEQAKNMFANFGLEYNPHLSHLKVLEAKTIIGGKSYPIDDQHIEDKSIPNNSPQFDSFNRIKIAYPKLDVPAQTFLKVDVTFNNVPLPNYFYKVFQFGERGYTQSEKINIVSEIPLQIEKNDPEEVINISETIKKEKDKTLYLISIEQKRPFIKAIADEEQAVMNPKHAAYVAVSSFKNWPDLGKALSVDYEKIGQAPLPALYQEIVNIANTKENPIEKINTVTSLLSEKIHCVDGFKTIKGHFIPQILEAVTNSKSGDCKDFAMATYVILKSMGIPSKIAFIRHGKDALASPINLPNLGNFNHAVVKVELPDQTLWIDPASGDSMAASISPYITNRKTLILDSEYAQLEWIPDNNTEKNRISIQEKWNMQKNRNLNIKGTLKRTGSFAKEFTGFQNYYSDESIKDHLVQNLNENYGQILEKDINLPPLKSRIVQDLSFDYSIKSKNTGLPTNSGIAMLLKNSDLKVFETKRNTVSDRYLGPPSIIEKHITIEGIKPQGAQSLNCNIESPWVDFTRTVEYKKDQMIIHQVMKVKKSWLEGTELESEAYKNLQWSLAKYVTNGIGVIFKKA